MTTYEIDITINDKQWSVNTPDIHEYTSTVITLILQKTMACAEHIEISIVLADNDFVQNLNKTYRHKDKPTNVLSFPQTEPDERAALSSPFISLGDIIIARETITKEALEQDKTIRDHYTHMLTHGCLHLLHYDHQNHKQAQEMEALEVTILKSMDIKNPYETI